MNEKPVALVTFVAPKNDYLSIIYRFSGEKALQID